MQPGSSPAQSSRDARVVDSPNRERPDLRQPAVMSRRDDRGLLEAELRKDVAGNRQINQRPARAARAFLRATLEHLRQHVATQTERAGGGSLGGIPRRARWHAVRIDCLPHAIGGAPPPQLPRVGCQGDHSQAGKQGPEDETPTATVSLRMIHVPLLCARREPGASSMYDANRGAKGPSDIPGSRPSFLWMDRTSCTSFSNWPA